MADLSPTYFSTPAELRKWFIDHYLQEKELLVGYYKVGTKIDSITWPQSVDEALCFGWIDGVRRSIDAQRYCIRFTPRKKNSIWSAVNLKRIAELDAQGLLTDTGRKVWQERKPDQQTGYSFKEENEAFKQAYDAVFQTHEEAWANWNRMVPSYRNPAAWWVMQAKQESTRLKRLAILIECSAQNQRIPPTKRTGEK